MTVSEAFRTKVFENFFEKKGFIDHQITTFNDFINHGIERIVRESSIFMEYEDIKYTIIFGEVYVGNPTIPEDDKYTTKLLFPNNARDMDLSYDAPIFVNITEIIEEPNKPKEIKNHIRVHIARIPIMLSSCKCNLLPLTKQERIKAGECENDQGGYFILDGKERVLVGQLRNIYNQPIVIEQKATDKYSYSCEIRSMSEESGHSVQVMAKIGRDDRTLVFQLPYIKDAIPVGIVFKALGFMTDEEITEVIGCKEPEIALYLKYLLRDSYFIRSQEDALLYIGQTPLRVIKDEERTAYAAQVVENEIFPHMGVISTIKEKAYLLGDMVNKLLRTHVGLRKPDDRDNYCNKRVEMSGVLCFELFRTLFKKFTKNIQLALDKKKQRPDIVSIISRNTSITLGLRHSYCITGDTLINVTNGLSCPINKLDGYDMVYSYTDKGLVSSNFEDVLYQGEKETVKLTFEDGRVLNCTPDHKILVIQNDKKVWVEANNIPINSKVVFGIDFTEDTYIDKDLDSKWNLSIGSETLSVAVYERHRTLAFMRILGYVLCDAHISYNNGIIAYMGSMFDTHSIINDCKIFLEDEKLVIPIRDNISSYGSTYNIRIPNEIKNLIMSLKGVNIGRKTTQKRTIPEFLMDETCPKSVIREFLGGLYGADGHSPSLGDREHPYTSINFSWSTENQFLSDLLETTKNIQTLCIRAGIQSKNTFINGPHLNKDTGMYSYKLRISSNTDFLKYIGFRHCIHKSYKLGILSCYWRYRENIIRQHNFVIDEVNQIKEKTKITIKEARNLTIEKLKSNEFIFNDYYSMPNEKVISHRREKNRHGDIHLLEEKFGVKSAFDFINDIGALNIFKGQYATSREDLTLPTYELQLVDIRAGKKQKVYDILNVKGNHNFVGGGLVLHNCTGAWGIPKASYIKKGVSQVLIRLSYGSFISHLRRIAIQVGKDGKNANSKIRQIDGSQIFYISAEECFDPMMPILTFSGDIKFAKDIKVGDILIDDLGNPTRVRSTTSGIKNMYTIKAIKRNYLDYKVTDNHILTLYINNKIQTRKAPRQPHKTDLFWLDEKSLKIIHKSFEQIEELEKFKATISSENTVDITIEDYLKLSKSIKNYLTLYKVENVNWPKQDVLLDPYILGLWLGDGLYDGYGFACNDTELIDAWMEWAEENDCEIEHQSRYKYHIKSSKPHKFCNLIRFYNLKKNKHIPKEYLINDRETRLKLLAGFIDTDGNVRDNGHEIRICQGPKNEHMIDQLQFLAQSLGFICNTSYGKSQWTGPDGNKRFSTYKELTIRGHNLYEIPTRVERKKLLPLADEKVKRNQAHSRSKFELIEEGIGEFVGWQLEGNGRFLGGDFTVLHNTPEGQSVGVVLNLALTATVTTRISTTFVKEVIKNFDYFASPDKFNESNYPKVFLNGVLIGITPNLTEFIKELKINRETGLLDKQVSFSYNDVDNEIKIFSDEGRFIRPIFACNNDGSLRVNELDYIDQAESEQKFDLTEFTDDDGNVDWQTASEAGKVVYEGIDFDDLVENQIIQYIDNNEVENSVIAMEPKELGSYKCDFCEIMPIGMMGVIGSTIPFSEHIPAARTIFQSSMAKQAVGMYALSYNRRTDTTAHVLNYGQKPLISTKPAEIAGFHEMVYGTNAIVAIACYGGFN